MIEIELPEPLATNIYPGILECAYCGNQTPHQRVGDHVVPKVTRGDVYVVHAEAEKQPFMMKCATCQQVSFFEKQSFDPVNDRWRKLYLVHPLMSVAPPEAPPKVQDRFKEALEVLNTSPSLCAVGLGKTLEAIMRDQEVPKMDLGPSIDHLVKKKKLPAQIGQMMHGLRELRNLGGHDDEHDDVRAEDVPVMVEFCRAIFEYLYVAPARLKGLQERLESAG